MRTNEELCQKASIWNLIPLWNVKEMQQGWA